MISRRLLRVKILQILYANHHKQDQSIQQSEKELFFSINKSYELYHYLILLLIELVRADEQRADNARLKLMPTHEDLNPNLRFIENSVIRQLRRNNQLSRFVLESKISWINNPEVVKNIYTNLRDKKYFQDYLTKDVCTYNDDKSLLLNIIEDCFPTMAPLEIVLEEISIFWNDDIDFILNMVHKTIKSFKETDGSEKKLMPLFKNDDDLEFTKKLFRKTYLNFEEYNELIKKHSQNWDFERIAIMDILIMRMALAEILEFPSIPVKVSLNEYIEIAKDYSTTNSNTFINGILDNIVKDLKNTKRITKTGRGLIDN